jgi:ADP-ribosylglycohydrolase
MARTGRSRAEIRAVVQEDFGYDLARALSEIRPGYAFDVSCQGSVPEALIAFLESDSYEDAVRNAVSLGGDSDTMACIAGAVAEAFYGGVPRTFAAAVRQRLPADLWQITRAFCRRFYPLSLQVLEAGPSQAS